MWPSIYAAASYTVARRLQSPFCRQTANRIDYRTRVLEYPSKTTTYCNEPLFLLGSDRKLICFSSREYFKGAAMLAESCHRAKSARVKPIRWNNKRTYRLEPRRLIIKGHVRVQCFTGIGEESRRVEHAGNARGTAR